MREDRLADLAQRLDLLRLVLMTHAHRSPMAPNADASNTEYWARHTAAGAHARLRLPLRPWVRAVRRGAASWGQRGQIGVGSWRDLPHD